VKVGSGYLVITRLWPAVLRIIRGTTRGRRDRLVEAGNDVDFPGDGAKRGEGGCFRLLGRVDDVADVARHRMEVGSALGRAAVAESAVVGITDELEGTRSQGS
jgi:acetyl-CoA synthetase